MALYLFLTHDDAASTASVLLYAGQAVDDLVKAVSDVGGSVHALVATGGRYTMAGLVDLPDHEAAVALGLVQASVGRDVELVPAVAVSDFQGVLEKAGSIMLTTASGDEASSPARRPGG